MSFLSDFLRLALLLIEKNNNKNENEILNLITEAASRAGISNSSKFGNAVNQLIDGARFLDSYRDRVYGADSTSQATLSRFSTFLRTEGKKNSILTEEYSILDLEWEKYSSEKNLAKSFFDAESIRFGIDSYFLRRYDALLTEGLQEMRAAYVRNTKFEQEINKGIENNLRYYTFFSLLKNGNDGPITGLKDVLTVSSEIMDKIIQNTELFQLRVIPLTAKKELIKNNLTIADQTYNISLGLNSSNIIKKLRTEISNIEGWKPGKEKWSELEALGQVFQGLIREDSKGNLNRILLNSLGSSLREDFKSLLKALQSSRIISQTGNTVDVNRLSEIMFDVKRILAVKNGKTIVHNVDLISSLTGLDVSFKKGGGVSVKTYGGTSNSILLTGATLITSALKNLGGPPTEMLLGIVHQAFLMKEADKTKEINELSKTILDTYVNAFNKKHSDVLPPIKSADIDSLMLIYLKQSGIEKDIILKSDEERKKLLDFIEKEAEDDADYYYNEAESEGIEMALEWVES